MTPIWLAELKSLAAGNVVWRSSDEYAEPTNGACRSDAEDDIVRDTQRFAMQPTTLEPVTQHAWS